MAKSTSPGFPLSIPLVHRAVAFVGILRTNHIIHPLPLTLALWPKSPSQDTELAGDPLAFADTPG